MAGTGIAAIELDDAAVRQALAALQAKAANLRPVMNDLGLGLVTATQRRFERQHDPAGKAWTPLSAATILQRLGGKRKAYTRKGALRKRMERKPAGLKILLARGHLRDSITHRAGPDFVEVGTNLVYARIHQLGGEAGRGLRTIIPARPFLGIDADDGGAILATLRAYLAASGGAA